MSNKKIKQRKDDLSPAFKQEFRKLEVAIKETGHKLSALLREMRLFKNRNSELVVDSEKC